MGEQPHHVPAGHFYSPIPDLAEVAARRDVIFDRAREVLGVDLDGHRQERWVRIIHGHYGELPFADEPGRGLRYGFDNDQFRHADAACLFGLLRHLRPKRLVEVGSGHSSALMLDVNEHDLDGAMQLTFVEPFPERLGRLLTAADRERVTIHEAFVQDVPLEVFEQLEDGDVLFIDSTHVSKVGSDVNHLLFEVLPRLAVGVWVHFHDIHFPFEYPEVWVDAGVAWNEAYLLRAFLMFNDSFQVELFLTQAELQAEDWFRAEMPLCLDDPGGSIWLRRVR
ncbi:MAG: class I SAM-dependent methyltransferase [Planctomycetota bacterium]|nr:class I SAM-dependent methyltransferase [Planctomycetota bacterium]